MSCPGPGPARRGRRLHRSARSRSVILALYLVASSSLPVLIALSPEVVAAQPPVTTQLVNSQGLVVKKILAGGNVIDTAALRGVTSNAKGTVTYAYFGNGGCTGTPLVVPSTADGLIVNVTGATVPNSPSVTFFAGTYSWQASYSGDGFNPAGVSLCEPLTVAKRTPGLSISLSADNVIRGGSVAAVALLTNSTAGAAGEVGYEYFSDSSCSGTNTTVFVGLNSFAAVLGGVVQSSSNYQQFSRAGAYSWEAVYAGDSNNVGAVSQCAALAVSTSEVTATTNLVPAASSSLPVVVSGQVADSVTLSAPSFPSGTNGAGGKVSYEYFSGSACSGKDTPVGHSANVTNGVVPNSLPAQFNSSGSHSWEAVYTGDGNYAGATSACEPFTVLKASPTLAISLSSSAIAGGQSIAISSSLSGGFQASGTVAYEAYIGNTCSRALQSLGTGAIGVPTGWSPVTPGVYSVNANYGGDGNNNVATSDCKALVVNNPGVGIVAQLRFPIIAPGVFEIDSANLTGTTAPAGGSVVYQYFTGQFCAGPATPVGAPKTVIDGIVPNSDPVEFNASGSYSWNAVYSGDSKNNAATSPCEPLSVGHHALTTLGVACNRGQVIVGTAVICTARLSNGLTSLPTGQVTWTSNRPGTFSGSACALAGGRCSVRFTPTAAGGPVTLTANYGGDANNFASPPGIQSLNVTRKASSVTVVCKPTSVPLASSSTAAAIMCTAKVKGYGDLTGEQVTWAQIQTGGGFVSFATSTCTIAKGSCSVTMTGALKGSVTVQATYVGDTDDLVAISRGVNLVITAAS